ncbi:MAG: efflux RND transporter periplasmic adaptor subunit [Gammaproteobacteria bacterium]|nr:efflux RND transporter periplasmic adaptor subunit [Gammaproteobacteria bacterium]
MRYLLLLLLFVLPVSFAEAFTAQAVLVPEHEVVLSSQMAGYVVAIPFKEGEQFRKDQVLLRFECVINHNEVAKAKARLEEAEKNYISNQRLNRLNAISQIELLKSKTKLIEAKANFTIQAQRVKYCEIHAPFNGQIAKLEVKPHQTVQQHQPLIQVLDNRDLRVELIVPSAWLQWLQIKDLFVLKITETRQQYSAHITKILPQVDSVSQTVRIFARLDKPTHNLVAGMSGSAIFQPAGHSK